MEESGWVTLLETTNPMNNCHTAYTQGLTETEFIGILLKV